MRGSNQEQRKITRESLLGALLDLWETKPFAKITVTELTHRAGVSRMAFYRNYESKEQIVAEHLREIYHEYIDELAQEGRMEYVDYAVRFFEHMAKNERFVRKAFAEGFSWALRDAIEDYAQSDAALGIIDVNMARLREDSRRHFAVGGYLSVLEKWFEGGMRESPEHMGKCTTDYIQRLLG